ncbi:MAG: hypothetical protein ACI93T_000702 [Porticoccaceae bacterium]
MDQKRVTQAAEEGICDVNSLPEDRQGAGQYWKFPKRGNTSRFAEFPRLTPTGIPVRIVQDDYPMSFKPSKTWRRLRER